MGGGRGCCCDISVTVLLWIWPLTVTCGPCSPSLLQLVCSTCRRGHTGTAAPGMAFLTHSDLIARRLVGCLSERRFLSIYITLSQEKPDYFMSSKKKKKIKLVFELCCFASVLPPATRCFPFSGGGIAYVTTKVVNFIDQNRVYSPLILLL